MGSKNKANNKNKTIKGSLIVVGVGVQAIKHLTWESRQAIENSEKVLNVIGTPIMQFWIKRWRPDSELVFSYYEEGKDRRQTYSEIVEHAMKYVRQGFSTCLVLYGHPGVYSTITSSAIETAEKEGFRAHMLPGISSEDCLFAELCVDPGDSGCQSFEATRFLVYRRKFDTFCHLILLQIGAIGDPGFNPLKDPKRGLVVLTEYLKQYYDSNHDVYVYEAATYSIAKPIIQRIPLYKLPEAYVDYSSTLYVPPIATSSRNIDERMVRLLGLAKKLGISQKH